MAEYKLSLIAEVTKKGNGFQQVRDEAHKAADEVKKAAGSAQTFSVEAAATAAKTDALNAKLRELGREVASGAKSLDAATKEFKEFNEQVQKDGIPNVTKNLKEASAGAENFGQRLNKTLGVVEASAAAAIAAGLTFKKAFDLAREGENIDRTRDKLDALAGTIHTTGEALLGTMREATRGSVDDLTLMDTAVTFLNMRFVENAEQAGALAQKILLLKKPTDDATTAVENFSLMLANQSIARLDSFGLSAGAVRTRILELQKANAGMTREQAFVIATMEQMDVAIQRQGLSVEELGTSFDRLEVRVQNATDSFKEFLAEGLEPVISMMAGDYDQQVENVIEKNIETAASLEELVEKAKGITEASNIWGGFGTLVTGTTDEMRAGIIETVRAMAQQADSLEEFEAAVEAGFGGQAQAMLSQWMRTHGETTESIYTFTKATEMSATEMSQWEARAARAATMQEDLAVATGEAAEAIRAEHQAMAEARGVNEDLADKQLQLAHAGSVAEQQARAANLALREQVEAQEALARATEETHRRINASVDSARDPVRQLIEAQQELQEVQGEWVQVTRTSSGEIEEIFRATAEEVLEINQRLAGDLSKEQRESWQEILETNAEGSDQWLTAYNALQADLTESQRAALVAQRGNLEESTRAQVAEIQAAGDEIVSVYTGDAEAAEEAQARMDEANAAIVESYRNAALQVAQANIAAVYGEDALAAQQAYLNLQVTLGTITQQEAAALLTIAENQEKIRQTTDELTQKYLADGELTTEESERIATAVHLIEEGFSGSKEALIALVESGVSSLSELESSTGTATDAVIELKDQANEFAGNSPYSARVEVDTSGAEGKLASLEARMSALASGADVYVTTGAGGQISAKKFAGGRVYANQVYLVGDGPGGQIGPYTELFVPDQPGQIVNARDTRSLLNRSASASLGGDRTKSPSSGGEVTLAPAAQSPEEAREAEEALRRQLSLWRESVGPLRELIEAQNELAQIQGYWGEVAEETRERITAANEAVIESYRKTAFEAVLANNGITEATLALGVQLGVLTEQEAQARLAFVRTNEAIEELTKSAEFNALSVEAQATAINLLVQGLVSTVEEAISAAASGSLQVALSGLFGRYHGGRVYANQAYLVGDGPGGRITPYTEIFVPDRPGQILSARDTAALLRSQANPPALGMDTPMGQKLGGGREVIVQFTGDITISNGMELADFMAMTREAVREEMKRP